MRIAMITPGLLPVPAEKGGAVEVLIQYLIEGNEKENNYTIDLYTVPCVNSYKYKHTNVINVKLSFWIKTKNKLVNYMYRICRIKKWRTAFGRKVVKMMKNQEYDLVVIHNNLMTYRDIYEKTKNKKNLVYVIHNDINDGDNNHMVIAKLIAKTAKKILAVSNYTKNNLLELYNTNNIEVMHNCIDMSQYGVEITHELKNTLRKKYQIDEDEYVFMYSGRLDVYKGVLELVKAFKIVNQKNTKLLIVGESWFGGDISGNSYLKLLSDETKSIKDKIVFTGFIQPEKMPKMYGICDCLVIPSLWEEPFGVVALEGMALKKPIIATKSGGLVEILDDECAYIVDRKNVIKALTSAMEKVLNNPNEARKKGLIGYNKLQNTESFHKENYYRCFCQKVGV